MSELGKTIRKAFGTWWFGVVVLLLVVALAVDNGWISIAAIQALANSAVEVIKALVPDGITVG